MPAVVAIRMCLWNCEMRNVFHFIFHFFFFSLLLKCLIVSKKNSHRGWLFALFIASIIHYLSFLCLIFFFSIWSIVVGSLHSVVHLFRYIVQLFWNAHKWQMMVGSQLNFDIFKWFFSLTNDPNSDFQPTKQQQCKTMTNVSKGPSRPLNSRLINAEKLQPKI